MDEETKARAREASIIARLGRSFGLLALRFAGLGLALIFTALVTAKAGLATLGAYAPYLAAAVMAGAALSTASGRRLARAAVDIDPQTPAFSGLVWGEARWSLALGLLGLGMLAAGVIATTGDGAAVALVAGGFMALNLVICRALNLLHHSNRGFGAERILTPLLSIGLFATFGADRDAAVFAVTAAPGLTSLYLLAVLARRLPRTAAVPAQPSRLSTLPFILAVALDNSLPTLTLFAGKALLDAHQLGMLTLAHTLAAALAVAHLSVSLPFVPKVVDGLRKGDGPAARRALLASCLTSAALAAVGGVVLAVGVSEAQALTGAAWVAPIVLALFCLGYVFRSALGATHYVLESAGDWLSVTGPQALAAVVLLAGVMVARESTDPAILLATAFAAALGARTLAMGWAMTALARRRFLAA